MDDSLSTSFQNIALSPRTPRFSPRTPRSAVYRKFEAGLDGLREEEEAELTLLGEDDRRQYADGLEDGFGQITRAQPLSSEEKRAMVLLCVLCMFFFFLLSCHHCPYIQADLIQGVPVPSFCF
jgi:hypothetical protein